jgi:chaperonin cofactor prefoldin
MLIAGLFIALALSPAALGFEETTLQAATDGLSAAGLSTLDHVFWRSGFGASVLSGPTFAGDQGNYDAFAAQTETWSGGAVPTGALPLFLEYSAVAAPNYTSGAGNDSDYATQRWNTTGASMWTGAFELGTGAAAQAAWAQSFLRTNHYANGTQDPAGTLVGTSNESGLMGLWLVQALADRVNATRDFAAYNGSALGAFDLGDPALNDDNASNGWQVVPDGFTITSSAGVFQSFAPADNRSSLGAQGALIAGLAETVALSDPAGAYSGLFDGSPFDSSLHTVAVALLNSVVMNAEAYHWNATATAYVEPDFAAVDTAGLALYVRGVAVAEWAVRGDAAMAANFSKVRAHAVAGLDSLSDANGLQPVNYTVAGVTVTGNFAEASLYAQAGATAAFAAAYTTDGLKADYDFMFRAGAALETHFYRNGSYRAWWPEPVSETYGAGAVSAVVGAQRSLALTGDEPLGVYRIIDAYETLVSAPPLVLGGAQQPPVVGASFAFNSTSMAASAASGYSAASLWASYEFVRAGAEFYAAVGGGVSVTEASAARLHNATAAEVGQKLDALDLQIANLETQLAALQSTFDALNSSVGDVNSRLNLSLVNETISQQRIADISANLTLLRGQLVNATGDTANATIKLDQLQANLTNLTVEIQNLSSRLWLQENATAAANGDLNVSRGELADAQLALQNRQRDYDEKIRELSRAQGATAIAAIVGVMGGFIVLFLLQRWGLMPTGEAKPGEKQAKGKEEKASEPDEDEDDEDAEK